MKTEKLWIPCTFEDRKPCILGNFLFIPQHYQDHEMFNFPLFSEIFKNNNPNYVEYCSGNGQWITEKAHQHPAINWIAVEKRFDRAKKIWTKAQKENLSNIFVVFGDAKIFSNKYLQENSISKIFINFPDPWPKKKHEKNRLIQIDFISAVSLNLKKNEEIIIATDHIVYCHQIIETFLNHPNWSSSFDKPHFVTNLDDYGKSFFSELFINKGDDIFYMNFQNKK
jgi:tRNA (guanine-N7-)-methyltransferase